jgi:hypothetical protein
MVEEITTADAQLRAERRNREAEEELARKRKAIEQFEDLTQSRADGTVVRFRKAFSNGGTAYTYAAIKANGEWYTTGPRGTAYSDENFCLWLVSGPEIATGFTIMVPEEG